MVNADTLAAPQKRKKLPVIINVANNEAHKLDLYCTDKYDFDVIIEQ